MFLVIKLLLLAVLRFNLKTALTIKEGYNNTVVNVDELLEDADVQVKLNGKIDVNFNADHFYTKLTSNVSNEFSWNTPIANERKKLQGLSQLSKPSVDTHIINYNRTTLPQCPSGLIGLSFIKSPNYRISICYFVTEPTSFPPQCPYPTTLEYNFISQYLYLKKFEQKHWAFTSRNVSDIGKKSCFITDRSTVGNLIPTSCSDQYPAVCVYSNDINYQDLFPTPTFTHYCKARYNESCIGYYINSPLTCYCKTNTEIEKLPRAAFCKKLVEITNPNENTFLVNLLGSQERCWIGLHKNKNLYIWSSTNTTNNYTFWTSNTDFSKTYGALGADGWLLEEDGTLNCAICEIEVEDHPQVHLSIKYNKNTNTVDVKITNALEVFQDIMCFAQNSDYYKKKDIRYNTHNFLAFKLKFPFSSSGYYWCKALQIPNLTPIYSNTIFIATNAGHEYAFLIDSQLDTSSPESTDDKACSSIKASLYKIFLDSKPVKIIERNEENKSFQVLCHITINPTKLSRTQEFHMISNFLKNSRSKVTNLQCIEICLPSVTISGNQILNWPETPIGVTTIPEELCLHEDGSPVTRTCTGNFYYGSRWFDVNGTCANVTFSHRTRLLHDLLISNTITPSSLNMAILNITKYTNNVTSFEIHLLSKALKKLATFNKTISVVNITKTVSNIMHFESNKLRNSQKILNSTDIILDSLDEMLARTEINDSGYTSEVTENLVVHLSDLKKTNVIGIKMEKTENELDSTKIIPIQLGTSQENIIRENFDIAVLFPQELHTNIGEKASANLITTVFNNDVLFTEQNNTNSYAASKIISLTIPNFDTTFTTPLKIIFNPPTSNNTRFKCAYWVYGFKDVMESTYGKWFTEGDPKQLENSNYQLCEFSHMTHFTLLILGGTDEISEGQKKALDIITTVGSGLSILGLSMVFLTAILFRRFRSGNAVVIHFSIAMTAQIVLLFIADNVTKYKIWCTVFGAALHYIVLAQFCWMLVIAILQYRRFVVVFSSPTRHLVSKACACSWGIPLIPVIIIISISRDNYGNNSYGLCYALGNYFIYGVVIPVLLIIFINLSVFLRIMLSIASSRNIHAHQKNNNTSSLQLRLAIMLFFLLGFTWGFGLLARVGGSIVYSYLFCITATLQGFVLFLYFIVLNEKTRSLWRNLKICYFKNNYESNVNTDSAATTMIRKSRNATVTRNNTKSTRF